MVKIFNYFIINNIMLILSIACFVFGASMLERVFYSDAPKIIQSVGQFFFILIFLFPAGMILFISTYPFYQKNGNYFASQFSLCAMWVLIFTYFSSKKYFLGIDSFRNMNMIDDIIPYFSLLILFCIPQLIGLILKWRS